MPGTLDRTVYRTSVRQCDSRFNILLNRELIVVKETIVDAGSVVSMKLIGQVLCHPIAWVLATWDMVNNQGLLNCHHIIHKSSTNIDVLCSLSNGCILCHEDCSSVVFFQEAWHQWSLLVNFCEE
jgi:hypothetical protein